MYFIVYVKDIWNILYARLLPGVISRGGSGGRSPLVKISAHVGGGSAPLKLLHWLGFSEFIGLASKVL